jgi:hypothetical protein
MVRLGLPEFGQQVTNDGTEAGVVGAAFEGYFFSLISRLN